MPSVTYAGNFNEQNGYPAATTNVKCDAESVIPAGSTITNVFYTLDISADRYSVDYSWILNALAVGGEGGSPYAYGSAAMYSNAHTFSGNMNFATLDVSKFYTNEIPVFAVAYTDHPTAKSKLHGITITVDYVVYSPCGAPGDVKLSSPTSDGRSVLLTWEAGTAGNENPVTGYQVQWRYSADGSAWGSWNDLSTTTATSLSVNPPTAFDSCFQYRVRTLGEAGPAFHSEWAESGVLRKVRPSMTEYTDPIIVGWETPVKAAHMLELQNNINALRVGLGLSPYTFTEIRAGYTSLAGWNGHVEEMRAAIDDFIPNHETWRTLGDNAPKAEAIMQLRRVVAAI